MPKNIGGEGERWGRTRHVEVARNDNGRIHLQFGEHLDPEDIWAINHPDTVDTQVERKPIKILGLKLK